MTSHFRELFEIKEIDANIELAEMKISSSEEEIRTSVKNLKNNRSP